MAEQRRPHKVLQARVSPDMHDRVVAFCAQHSITQLDFMERAVEVALTDPVRLFPDETARSETESRLDAIETELDALKVAVRRIQNEEP